MISNSNECSNCVSPISSSSSLSFVSQPLLARIDRSMCRWMEIDQRVRDRYPSNHERLPTIFLRWSLYPSRLATTLNTHTHTHTHTVGQHSKFYNRATVYDTNVPLWRIVTATLRVIESTLCALFIGFDLLCIEA